MTNDSSSSNIDAMMSNLLTETSNENLTTSVSGLTQLELEDLQAAFTSFEIDPSTQTIAMKDVMEIVQELSSSTKNQDVLVLLERYRKSMSSETVDENNDSNNNSNAFPERCTFDEFVQLLVHPTDDNDDENTVYTKLFRQFDTDNKGYITVADLQRIATDLGEHDLTNNDLQEMIQRATTTTSSNRSSKESDQDDVVNDKVTLDEFTAIMNKNLFQS